MQSLGRLFDIGEAFTPVDFNTADAATGHRVHLRNCTGITCVLFKGAGTAGADPVVTIQEHTAATAGTSATLAGAVSEYWKKEETTLDGDEAWARVAVSPAAGSFTLTTSAASEGIYVFEVEVAQLSAGYEWLSFNIAATVANAQLVSGFYITTGLHVQRVPTSLTQLNL